MKDLKPLEKIIIALYARKSVFRDTSISVDLQLQNMEQYFLNRFGNRCKFIRFKDDGYTGRNENRPDFQRMIAAAKQNCFDIIAVYKIDRCSRNTYDFTLLSKSLETLGVMLVSTSEGCDSTTEQGRMVMNLLSTIGQWENSQISQRVTDSKEALAKLGCFTGGHPPVGYKSARLPGKLRYSSKKLCYLQIDVSAKDLVNKIFALSVEGYSTYSIGKFLDIPPKTIANIIQNPTYVKADEKSASYIKSLGFKIYGDFNGSGFLPYNRRCKKNGKKESNSTERFVTVSFHEPIVSSDIWIAANENVKSRGKEKRPRISNKSFLAHLVECSCGSGMYVHETGSKNSKYRNSYFRCSAQKQSHNCDSKWLKINELESAILTFLNESPLDEATLKNYCNSKNSTYIDYNSLIQQKKIEILELEEELKKLCINFRLVTGRAADLVNNDIASHELMIEEIENEISTLQAQSLKNLSKLDLDTLYSHIKWLINNLDKITVADRHLFAKNIISIIEYNGSNKAKVIF